MMKAIHRGDGVIATITNAISVDRRSSLCRGRHEWAKGTENQFISYLRHCYDKLRENDAPVFDTVTAPTKTTRTSTAPSSCQAPNISILAYISPMRKS
jgi:hypothetical protein